MGLIQLNQIDKLIFNELFFKVLIATVSGFIVGISREKKGKSAGLKTNTLIAVGSCIFTVIALSIGGSLNAETNRVISQIVSGVGFLGAGTIFQSDNKVYGLTSAAFVWVVAGLGILAGIGAYLSSILLAFGCIFTISIIDIVEEKIIRCNGSKENQ